MLIKLPYIGSSPNQSRCECINAVASSLLSVPAWRRNTLGKNECNVYGLMVIYRLVEIGASYSPENGCKRLANTTNLAQTDALVCCSATPLRDPQYCTDRAFSHCQSYVTGIISLRAQRRVVRQDISSDSYISVHPMVNTPLQCIRVPAKVMETNVGHWHFIHSTHSSFANWYICFQIRMCLTLPFTTCNLLSERIVHKTMRKT